MKKLIRWAIGKIDNFYPKNNTVIFSSFPDYSDNPYALFSYLVTTEYAKKKQFVWLVDNSKQDIKKQIYEEFGKTIKVENKLSIRGIGHYLSAKFVFFSHGIYGFIPSYNNNKRINLWHGMPLKSIGALDSNFKGDKIGLDKLVVTSKIFSNIYSKAFKLSEENISILGQPRNDLLFQQSHFFKKLKIKQSLFAKTVMWMPTYLKSVIGDIRIDGNFDSKKISILRIEELKALNNFLSSENVLLIIKLHPMDYFNNRTFDTYSNIIIIKHDNLYKINEQLYPLLGKCDALLTDFSSVYIDFLILNKPIAFTIDNMEEYKHSRGLVFENIEDVLSGPVIDNYEDLLIFLKNLKRGIDHYQIKREEVNATFNRYSDSSNAKRVADHFLKP